jgi:hypothetical protein
LASLGLAKPIKDMGFQLEFNSLAHLVQKLTSYEQCHPEIYQDKIKLQIALVDTEDAEDSGEEQECHTSFHTCAQDVQITRIVTI